MDTLKWTHKYGGGGDAKREKRNEDTGAARANDKVMLEEKEKSRMSLVSS